TALLSSAMPHITTVAGRVLDKTAEKLEDRISDESVTAAQSIWDKLIHKSTNTEALESARLQVINAPDDLTARRTLAPVLAKALSDDEALASEIRALLDPVDVNDIFSYFKERPEDLQHSFDNLIADKARGFVGRGFVLQRLDEFIEANPESGGYFIIQGDPGIGKSAIMAHLVKTRGYVHHFNIALQSINKPSQFLNSVCKQLIDCYSLKNLNWPENADKDGAFLNRVLSEVSTKLEDDEKVVIAIDALDEVDMTGVPSRTNLLFLPESLPNGVFVVATTRREQDLAIQAANLRVFPLLPESTDNIADVRQYVQAYFQDTQLQQRLAAWGKTETEFEDTLVTKSEGNFMYLRYVLPAIQSGYFTDVQLSQLPDGLRAYYQIHWKHMKDVEKNDFDYLYKPVVCVLAAVKEPVSIDMTAEYTERTPDQVSEVIKKWIEFLHEEKGPQGEPLFGVYHLTFKSFLSDEVDPGLKTYHAMIARYYERLMET
ncbi:MAG: P-loop domain-containing protein, partial [Halobacteriota archaeon]